MLLFHFFLMKNNLKNRYISGHYSVIKKVLIISSICWLVVGGVLFYFHRPLSDELFSHRTGTSLKITDRHGTILRETLSLEGGRNTWLTYENIPEKVIRAVIETEDKRFFSHPGVDLFALGRAVWQNVLAGEVVSGASTITQQLIKMRFGYPRTLWGKFQEMVMALRLEHTMSKQEILRQYVNRVSFSNQVFGIEAAARLYFGKPAQHLSLAETVFLVGLIQAPSRYNPYRHFPRALQRQRALLERMYQRETITKTTYQIAQREDIQLISKNVHFKAPHFCEVVLEQLSQNPPLTSLKRGKADRMPARHGIALVKTTLDYYLQEQVEEIVTTRIEALEDYNVTNAALIVLDNHDGDILAFVGSKDFFDNTISGQFNGVLSLRQPGSTLKPFTYQLALERSYTPATLLPDIKDLPAAPRSFLPENYDRKFHGPVRLREALACSYNIPAFRILEDIGVEALYQRLHEFGFDSLQELPSFYGPGLTLGNGEVTLLELTRAYSMLARRGKKVAERYILDMNSRLPTRNLQSDVQLFSPHAVYLLTHILADRQAAVPAFGENTPLELPFQTAGKTGTSKDYRDNWTIGFTRDYTVGVWVGNFDGSPMRRVSGITGAAPIYRDVMLVLYRDYNPLGLLDPVPKGLVKLQICPLSGKLINEDCPHAIEEIFLEGTEPTETCEMHEAYWVDTRDGLLTNPTSPYAIQQIFIHFPPQYQSWAHEMVYPLPPRQYSSYSSFEEEQEALQNQRPIQIVHPSDGDVYAIDPILRREYQTLQLSAVVVPDISQVTWYINDEPWEAVNTPFQTSWEIFPGTHRIYVEGQYNGKILRSQEITVEVVK